MTDLSTGQGGATPSRRVLLILLLVYIFNFIDRQLIGILSVPIKAELALSDTQLGLMGGVAFALFYTGLGVPIAWVADRCNRVTIISCAIALWSTFTALCGFAQSFWHLLFARMGVGFGEAGGTAPSISLIADYFPPERRARALAIFTFGAPIGSAFGVFFGGWIASHVDWRTAFVTIGLSGLSIVALLRFGVKEAVRGGFDRHADAAQEPVPPFLVALATVVTKPSFWLLSFGGAFSAMCTYGLMFWLPSYFARSFDMPLGEVAWFYGSIILIGGITGTWLGGWLSDRLGAAGPKAYGLVPAVAMLVAAPALAYGLFTTSLAAAFCLFLISQAVIFLWIPPILMAIQHIVPARMRTTVTACHFFITNLLGIGFGTYFFGFMSDVMTARYGAQGLRYSMLCGIAFYLLAALLFALAAARLRRDWHSNVTV